MSITELHPERWLKAGEVAARLGVHKVTVYRYIREKKLPGVQFGGNVRIPESALDAWMQRQLAQQPYTGDHAET
jgi:excisionase family DNA binding protein